MSRKCARTAGLVLEIRRRRDGGRRREAVVCELVVRETVHPIVFGILSSGWRFGVGAAAMAFFIWNWGGARRPTSCISSKVASVFFPGIILAALFALRK